MTEHQLYLSILTDDTDPSELANLTHSLRRELLDLDIQDAKFVQGAELPEGAKSAGAINWNTLILTIVGSGGVVSSLVMLLNSWVQRNRASKLSVTFANGAQLTFEGTLAPGSDLYQFFLDVMQVSLTQPAPQTPAPQSPAPLPNLRETMSERLSLSDVRTIYFNLGLDYEQFGSDAMGKNDLIMLLLTHCQRHERLAELRAACKKQNGAVEW